VIDASRRIMMFPRSLSMTFSDQSYNLRIELDTKGCELSADEIEEMEIDLDTLKSLVSDFPVSDLHITVVYHQKAHDYHVKTSLMLSGRKLFTGERHAKVHPAFESCIRKLTKKVRAYKRQMRVGEDAEKHSAGTRHDVVPIGEINLQAIVDAVSAEDYAKFRREIDVFEPSLAQRISHWIERYPEIGSRLEHPFQVSDIVEEVFLNAFDRFESRSHQIPPGQWLESLIDPSVQALLQSPDEEYQRIQFAKAGLSD
jgi:ribosome-associated translation inhibitor RaiA